MPTEHAGSQERRVLGEQRHDSATELRIRRSRGDAPIVLTGWRSRSSSLRRACPLAFTPVPSLFAGGSPCRKMSAEELPAMRRDKRLQSEQAASNLTSAASSSQSISFWVSWRTADGDERSMALNEGSNVLGRQELASKDDNISCRHLDILVLPDGVNVESVWS